MTLKTALMTALVASAALIAPSANAAVIEITGSGVFGNGEAFTYVATYDTNAPIVLDFFTLAYYSGPISLSFFYKDVTYQSQRVNALVFNDEQGYDRLQFSGGGNGAGLNLYFKDESGTALTTTSLPNIAQLGSFPDRSAAFYFEDEAYFADDITYTAREISAVPEASTWGMMILGFGMIGAASRSRKVKTSVKFT